MEFSIFNIDSEKESEYYVTLAKSVLNEFPELSAKYQNLAVILAKRNRFQDGTVSQAIRKFFSAEELNFNSAEKIASSGSIGNKGYVSIVLDEFCSLSIWEQKFVLRHECGHLLLHSSIPSPTVRKLLEMGCPIGFISKMRNAQHDYQIHEIMLKKYPDDWFKKPVRISESAGSPRKFYRAQKKKLGVNQALFDAIWNSFNLIRLIYLNEQIIRNFKKTEPFITDLQRYETQLTSFWNCIQKDSKGRLPMSRDWVQIEDLEDEERFFQKVSHLLYLCFGKLELRKTSLQASVHVSPSVQFSHVAIGGSNAWESENMEKIKAANISDVTTILRFNMPFSLLRLPNGSYEMKDGQHSYRFLINRLLREAEVAKNLTGWVPVGDIDIIGDRFGRFSYSQMEIQIPYRIVDDEMFEYACPNCKREVDKSTTVCSVCGATFNSEKSRVPPRKKVKIKAIELVNKFLDAYRFFFKDYFVEHIRYDDIISYEIEYSMTDGTKVSWNEEFDLSLGSVVKTGTLTADQKSLEKFKGFLCEPDEKMVLRDYLLSSAANRISTEEYHLAILESVIALEITLSEYILQETTKLGLPKHESNDLIRIIGLYGSVRVILKLFTKDKEQLSASIYEKCEKAIRKRNKIVHKADTVATYNEASESLWNISRLIEYIVNLSK